MIRGHVAAIIAAAGVIIVFDAGPRPWIYLKTTGTLCCLVVGLRVKAIGDLCRIPSRIVVCDYVTSVFKQSEIAVPAHR